MYPEERKLSKIGAWKKDGTFYRPGWSIPPTPYDQRLCSCGNYTQDEKHIIEVCPFSASIRSLNPDVYINAINILNYADCSKACDIIFEIYNIYNL